MTIREELSKAWRLGTAAWRAMPSIVIAGAPKCGTSTLYDYLVEHPRVRRGARKEPTNFLHYPGSRWRSAMNYPLRLGRDFRVVDGSVEYFAHPDGPKNVAAVVGEARLVFLLRDPVQRAWSDYRMFRDFGTEREDFGVVVDRAIGWLSDPGAGPLVEAASRSAWNPVRYVRCGLYAQMIERWLEAFPREACLFLVSEDFFADPQVGVRAVQRHVGLPEVAVADVPVARAGRGGETLDAGVAERLREFYAGENVRLATLLGRTLPWN